MRTLQAFDVDTDDLADTFERMAAGLRDGGVALKELETNHRAVVEDPSTFYFGMEFVADHEYEDVVDAIEYVGDTDDPEVDEDEFAGSHE